LKRVPLDRRIRLLGVRVGALSKIGAQARDETCSAGGANSGVVE